MVGIEARATPSGAVGASPGLLWALYYTSAVHAAAPEPVSPAREGRVPGIMLRRQRLCCHTSYCGL